MSAKQINIAILASGSGTNAQEIINYFQSHTTIRIAYLLSNNPQAYALERAKKHSVPTTVFSREQFKDSNLFLGWLKEKEITHIVLAGFLWLIPEYLVKAYPKRIINIHPALLPSYGGKGMYGMKVHQAVKDAGDAETGITIHEVDEVYDNGDIIFQVKCQVMANDTPEQIANRIHQLEYTHFPRVIEAWAENSTTQITV